MDPYKPPFLHRSAHFSTIVPNLFRPTKIPPYERITINTPDDDFIDVDGLFYQNNRAVLLLHGLEGSSRSQYVASMANQLFNEGYDVLAMNHRGCSGRDNLKIRSYHSGNTEDVVIVLDHFRNSYESIDLVGYSLGGNIALKLAANELLNSDNTNSKIVAISAPIDLKGCANELGKFKNKVYLLRFLRSLKQKALFKTQKFPEASLEVSKIRTSQTFYEFDEYYTAPVHGFKSALDYYERCSSKPELQRIDNPTLLINAENDTFLSRSCFPIDSQLSTSINFLKPKYGGHVGFASNHSLIGSFWHEQQILDFLR